MNIEFLTKNLGRNNLEQHIIDEYTKGKEEAELLLEELILKSNEEINKFESEEVKTARILSEIISLKKSIDLSFNNELYLLVTNAKNFAFNSSIKISTEKEELLNFAKYYLAFYEFQKTREWLVLQKIKNLRNSSKTLHLQTGMILGLNHYFDILNNICKIDSFTWSWETFEDGLTKIISQAELEKIELFHKHKFEIEKLNRDSNYENDKLKSDIKDLEEEISRLKGEIEYRADFHNKYYYDTQTIINNTYFGDNQPFLFNLYNFLKSNNVLSGGWSYFYSSMTIGNNEMVFLNTTKKLKFLGRLFYHLRDFLILHFRDDPDKFIRNKFYLNNEPLGPHFFKNHVNIKFDKELDPFITEIDAFFDKQKKIYLKG